MTRSERTQLFVVGIHYRVLRDVGFLNNSFFAGEVVRYERYQGYSRYDGCHVHTFRAADGKLKEWWFGDEEPLTLATEIFERVDDASEIVLPEARTASLSQADPDPIPEQFRVPVLWKKISTSQYKAEVRGGHWRLIMGDFPSEPLWILLINSSEVARFTVWPPEWRRKGLIFSRPAPT